MQVSLITPQQEGSSSLYSYTTQIAQDDGCKEDIDANIYTFKQGSINPIEYLKLSYRATKSNSQVIHIQHEYGVFGPFTIMSWIFFPVLWILATLHDKPVVITVHEVINRELIKDDFMMVKSTYINSINHIIGLTADYLIFLSGPAEDQFKEFTHKAPTEYIAHGTSTEKKVDLPASEAKRKLGFDSDTNLITEFGYISERKGSDFFVKIAKQLPQYEFLLAGGSEKGNTKFVSQLQEDSPRNLHITGELEQEKFHTSFIASDVAVLPYRENTKRGFINEVKQSGILNWCMTYELPVIASDCRYFRNLEEEYQCLRTFERGDLDNATHLLEKVMESEEEAVDLMKGVKLFKEDNAMEKVRGQHFNVYRQLQ